MSVPHAVCCPIQNRSEPSAAHWISCVPQRVFSPPICSYVSARQSHLYTNPSSVAFWSVVTSIVASS